MTPWMMSEGLALWLTIVVGIDPTTLSRYEAEKWALEYEWWKIARGL